MTKQNTCLLYHTFLYFSIGNDFAKKINQTVCESVPFEIVSFSDANTVLYNLLQSVDITHRSLPSGNLRFYLSSSTCKYHKLFYLNNQSISVYHS